MASELPERLKAARTHLGLTAGDMAAKIGSRDRKTWERYERGETRPNSDALGILAALGFDMNWVLTGEGPMRRPPPGAVASPPAAPPTSPSTTAGLDENLIRDCIVGTEMYLEETNRYLQPEKKAQLIIALYHLISEKQLNEKLTNTPSDRSAIIDRLFKLAS